MGNCVVFFTHSISNILSCWLMLNMHWNDLTTNLYDWNVESPIRFGWVTVWSKWMIDKITHCDQQLTKIIKKLDKSEQQSRDSVGLENWKMFFFLLHLLYSLDHIKSHFQFAKIIIIVCVKAICVCACVLLLLNAIQFEFVNSLRMWWEKGENTRQNEIELKWFKIR